MRKNWAFLLCVISLLVSPSSGLSQVTRFTRIGPDPASPYTGTSVTALSRNGTFAAGVSMGDGIEQVFVWEGGIYTPVPTNGWTSLSANGVSNSGMVVGSGIEPASGKFHAFRWSADTGFMDLGGPAGGTEYEASAGAISADGAVIVGTTQSPGEGLLRAAFRYENGVMTLLPGENGRARAVSDEGSIIVGQSHNAESASIATKWEHGVHTFLGTLPSDPNYSNVFGISPEGSVVVGRAGFDQEAMMWTQAGGMQALPWGQASDALVASSNGRVIAGRTHEGGAAFQTAEHGLRTVKSWLENEHGMDLSDWLLREVTGISSDEKVMAGWAYINSEDVLAGWIVETLPEDVLAYSLDADPAMIQREDTVTVTVEVTNEGGNDLTDLVATIDDDGSGSIIEKISGPDPESYDAIESGQTHMFAARFVGVAEGTALLNISISAKNEAGETVTGSPFCPIEKRAGVSDCTDEIAVGALGFKDGTAFQTVDELYLPGDEHIIEWRAPLSETVDLYFTTDRQPDPNAETNTLIAAGLNADSELYEWTVPDTLSPSIRLLIKDADDTEQYDFSPRFRVRPYWLVRIKPDSTYERFKPTLHAWAYDNASEFSSPESERWWTDPYIAQFDTYLDKIDPYTDLSYAADTSLFQHRVFVARDGRRGPDGRRQLRGAPGEAHPEWTSMVRAVGIDDTYRHIERGISAAYDHTAAIAWTRYGTRGFGGACYGMAVSAGLLFADPGRFGAAFPSIGAQSNLFAFRPDLTEDLDVIRDVNTLLSRQFDRSVPCHDAGIVERLRELFEKDDRSDNLELSIVGARAAHALTPYRLEEVEGAEDRYRIYVYDPNHAGDDERFIEIEASTDRASYAGWGSVHVTLNGPIEMHYSEGDFEFNLFYPDAPCGRVPDKRGEWMRILTGRDAFAVEMITSAAGQIGWQADSLYQTLDAAVADFFVGGIQGPPFGYHVPTDAYRIERTVGEDSTAGVVFIHDGLFLNVDRHDALPGESDVVAFDPEEGITIRNDGPETRHYILTAVTRPTSESERIVVVDSLAVSSSDSVRIRVDGIETASERLLLDNPGAETSYDLTVRHVDMGGAVTFQHEEIELSGGATHSVEPAWGGLGEEDVLIHVDMDGDGTVDEIIPVENEGGTAVHVDEILELGELPRAPELGAPYPNPFGRHLAIPFEIGVSGDVRISMYDVLGREVVRPVDGRFRPGSHEIELDASGLAPGLYLVRMEAAGVVVTRAVTLVR